MQGKNCEKYNIGEKLIYVTKNEKKVLLHSQYMDFSKKELSAIIRFLFDQYKDISEIDIPLINIKYGVWRNAYPKHIILPKDNNGINKRLSKKESYNLRREMRCLNDLVGGTLRIEEYEGMEKIPHEIVNSFFEMKKETHNVDYNLTAGEYLKEYCVDHAYVMMSNDGIISILFSCEQCECVYFENFTYDEKYSKFSPGMIIYNYFLNSLVNKGKEIVYIGGGTLDYKRKYDSIEEHRFYCTVYRSCLRTVCIQGYRKMRYYTKLIKDRII